MGRTLVVLVAALFALVGAAVAQTQPAPKRVALIIGNANYAGYPTLPNTHVDVGLVAGALRTAGFNIVQRTDLDGDGMRTALAAFRERAAGAQVALVYFAGHGMESGGRNWLLPTGAQLNSIDDLEFKAIEATLIVQATSGARARVIVLDACRNNPLAMRMRGVTRDTSVGLAAPREPVRGTLFMYSAGPGQLAQDGPPGRGSPFARAFATYIVTPGMDLRRAAGAMSEAVYRETSTQQTPFQTSSLSDEELVFVAAPISIAPLTQLGDDVRVSTRAAETAAFEVAAKLWSVDGWQAFLRAYPEAQNASLARAALASLQRPTQSAASPAMPIDPLDAVRRAVTAITELEWRAAENAALVSRVISGSSKSNLEALATNGHARAQALVGSAYRWGLSGFPVQGATAARFLRLAVAQNDLRAQDELGSMYRRGEGGLQQSDTEAVRLWGLSAAQGNAGAQSDLGFAHEIGLGGLPRNGLEAARLYRLSAAQGNPSAQANLGAMYVDGDGGLARDPVEAVRLYRLSAAQGNAIGQANLGVAYRWGLGGLTRDLPEALRLLRLAAAKGDSFGREQLGEMYERGEGGLTADRAEAVRLYKLAARQGDESAQRQLRRLGETW